MSYNAILSLFCCSNYFSFGNQELLQVSSCVPLESLFPPSFSFFKYFLTFWIHKMLQVYLAFSFSQPWNQPFFKESQFFIEEQCLETMICMIGVLITTRLSLLLGTLWVRDKKFICVYTYMHIYTSVFLHLFVCGPLKNYKFILIPQIPISPTGFISPISLFATSFSNSEKTGSFYLQYYIYCSILVHIQSSFKTANPQPCEKHI